MIFKHHDLDTVLFRHSFVPSNEATIEWKSQTAVLFFKTNRRSLFNCRNSLSSPDLSLAMHPNFLLTHFVDSNRFELLPLPVQPVLPRLPRLPVLPLLPVVGEEFGPEVETPSGQICFQQEDGWADKKVGQLTRSPSSFCSSSSWTKTSEVDVINIFDIFFLNS